MPEMRLPLAIFTNAHRDAPLLAQLEKALRPRTLLHVDAALLRLLREPALGISLGICRRPSALAPNTAPHPPAASSRARHTRLHHPHGRQRVHALAPTLRAHCVPARLSGSTTTRRKKGTASARMRAPRRGAELEHGATIQNFHEHFGGLGLGSFSDLPSIHSPSGERGRV